MNTNNNYNDDSTMYQDIDNEATQYEDAAPAQSESAAASGNSESEVKVTKSGWKSVAAGAGTGLLIGSVATLFMGMKNPDSEDGGKPKKDTDNHREELSHPEWVDDQVPVASSVNDDMSFGEAFAAARNEVGPGGVFEWHGQLYGTYTADEWNSMTAEQRAEYSDHFSWNHIDHSSSNVAQHSSTTTAGSSSAPAQTTTNDDDIEVVSVNHDDTHVAQNDGHTGHTPDDMGTRVDVVDTTNGGDPEIEILGVVHDDESGANIGGMTVNDQEVILIDVNGDLTFDYMAVDANNDGQVSENELIDIQDQSLTVNDLGGFTNPAGDMLASNDAPDYSNGSVYEG